MKKVLGITILALVCASMICGTVLAATSVGPAPNSGDGTPDGSGFEEPNGQYEQSPGTGPAPNSGDCIPDGSGF
ncbi:MAG: hypothetical protein WC325_06290 [Candidatus Bathyarchaeia archaeon]